MTAGVDAFAMSPEQYPTWEYFKFFSAHRAPSLSPAQQQSHLFFWARNAIYYGLEALGISKGAHVLVPSYVCTAAVEPFTAFGAEVDFYPVERNCEPNFAEIEARIGPRTAAILAVHYFGFPQKIREFRELCDRRHIALIEDCAHVFRGETAGAPLGSFGDVSIFSWRKCLPLYDGAELRVNRSTAKVEVDWNRETLPFTLKVAKSLLDRLLQYTATWPAKALARSIELAKKLVRRASGTPSDRPLMALDSNRASFDPGLLNQPISRVSKWLLKHTDVAAVVAKRRENFRFLLNELRGLPGVEPLHTDLPENTCPWVFALFFDGLANAHLLLRELGVPAVTWGGVRPQAFDAKSFPVADFLYDNLVFLPIHQNLSQASLRHIVACVARVGAHANASLGKHDGACAVA